MDSKAAERPRSEPEASEGGPPLRPKAAASEARSEAKPSGDGPPLRPEERGVHNPRVVDLVRLDPTQDCVELQMLETRAWGSDPLQLGQLEEKFNAYLGYVQGGYLGRDYPHYAGKRVRFRLECAEPPQGETAGMLDAMRDFAAREGIGFAVEATRRAAGGSA